MLNGQVFAICSQLCCISASIGASGGGIFDAIMRVVGMSNKSYSASGTSYAARNRRRRFCALK